MHVPYGMGCILGNAIGFDYSQGSGAFSVVADCPAARPSETSTNAPMFVINGADEAFGSILQPH
jgi:hypothetical protein